MKIEVPSTIEEWNARGGYLKRKIPFELVVSNDNGLWGSSGNEIVKQAYEEKVWGILGTIDGANSHIAIRVALKAEVLMFLVVIPCSFLFWSYIWRLNPIPSISYPYAQKFWDFTALQQWVWYSATTEGGHREIFDRAIKPGLMVICASASAA